jgi:glyoxylate reductase
VTRVFISHRLPGDALTQLPGEVDVWPGPGPVPATVLAERAAGCDALVVTLNERVGESLLAAAPRLRIAANVAAGYDNIDVAACTRHGVVVTNTPGVLTAATADLTMALLLAMTRRLPEAARAVRDGAWAYWDPCWLLGLELSGATLGIIGWGQVGQAVAARARAFGMHIAYHSRSAGLPLDQVLAAADVVSLHAPLTPATRGLIGGRELALMKPTAVLVNTARGALVHTGALVEALRTGQIAGAGLDVAETEPLPAGHPLLALPNCLVLPHIGSATWHTRSAMAEIAIRAVLAELSGHRPPTALNWDAAMAHRA